MSIQVDPLSVRITASSQPWVPEVGYMTFEESSHTALRTAMNTWAATLKASVNSYHIQPPVFLTDQPGNKIRVLVPYVLWIPPPEPL